MTQRATFSTLGCYSRSDVVERDPDDNHILECSQASRSDYIVTKDKHLLDLKIYAGARIIKPHEFLSIVRQRAQE